MQNFQNNVPLSHWGRVTQGTFSCDYIIIEKCPTNTRPQWDNYLNSLYSFIYFIKPLKFLKKCSTSFKEHSVLSLQHLKFSFFFLGKLFLEGEFSFPLFCIMLLFSHLYIFGIINPFMNRYYLFLSILYSIIIFKGKLQKWM